MTFLGLYLNAWKHKWSPKSSLTTCSTCLYLFWHLYIAFSIQLHYHNLLACSHRSAALVAQAAPDNAPCSVLEASKSLCCGSLLVSISLPVPSVLTIRLTAKQHNVVELTGSQHNLATVCSYPYGQFVFHSHTEGKTHKHTHTHAHSSFFLYLFPLLFFLLFSLVFISLVNSLPPCLFTLSLLCLAPNHSHCLLLQVIFGHTFSPASMFCCLGRLLSADSKSAAK